MTQSHPNSTPEDLRSGLGILQELVTLTDASPRDLGNRQLVLLRKLFEDRAIGLYLFNQHIMGYEDLTESLHLPICRLIGRWGESVLEDGTTITHPPTELDGTVVDSYRRLMVCIPREHFKTSCCTRGGALWTLARDSTHNPTVGLYNAKAENSEAWVGAICQVVERSLLFQALWPEMLPRGISYKDREEGKTLPRRWKWGATGILFERDAIGVPELSIEPHGIGGESAGKHFTHMILDDIIGKEAAYSPAIMQTAIAWVDNKRPLERPAENGCELVVHTPWAYHDVYAHMRAKWPGEYKVHRRHALEDPNGQPDHLNGKSIFPQKLSTEKLKKMFKTDFFINMAQYQCVPRMGRDQSFTEEDFRFGKVRLMGGGERLAFEILPESYDPTLMDPECEADSAPRIVPLNYMTKAVILDPAPTRTTEIRAQPRSANGIVVVGIDCWGRRYCLESQSVQAGPTDVLKAVMHLCDKWGAMLVGIEEVNFSAVYAPLFQAIIRHEYDFEPDFIPCKTENLDKPSRVKKKLIRVVENHFMHFNTETCREVCQEMAEFPNGDRYDCLDALSYMDDVVQRPSTPEELETQTRYRKVAGARGLTGYGQFMDEQYA